MSQIKKKFIENNAIDGSKLQLLNGQAVRAVDTTGADRDLFYFNSSNEWQFSITPKLSVDPQGANDLVRKNYVDAEISAEASARASAISSLQSSMESADSAMDARLDVIEGGIIVVGSIAKAQKDAQDYADQKIADLINGAPGVLDTLKELSDALGGDENFATTIANQLANIESSITNLENASSGDLAAEEAARMAADEALDARLDILEGADSVEGSVAKALKDAKDYTDAEVLAEQNARETAVSNEAAARQSADDAMDARLDIIEGGVAVEGSVAKALFDAKAYTDAEVADEAAARQSADDAMDARLDVLEGADTVAGSVAKALKDAKDYTDSEVSAEESARIAAVSAEESARIAADDAMDARLDVLEGADTVEGSVAKAEKDAKDYADSLNAAQTSERIEAIGNLQYQIVNILENTDPAALDSLAEVVSAFQAADGNLNNTISALGTNSSSALAAETQARQQADSAEASARQAADAAEASARQAADAAETAAREASLPRYAKHASTLGAGESYKDLSHKAVDESLNVFIDRLALHANDDYTVSTSPSGHTRITFTGSFMSSEEGPAAGDLFRCSYAYKNSDQPAVPPPGGAGGGVGPGAGGSSADNAWAALGQWSVSQTGPQQVQIVRASIPAGAEPTSPMNYSLELYDVAGPVSPITGMPVPLTGRAYMTSEGAGPTKVWSLDLSANPLMSQLQAGHTYRARVVTTSGTTIVVVQDFAGFTA